MREEVEQYKFDESGDTFDLVPAEPRKLKARGIAKAMMDYMASDYPVFQRKVTEIGLSIQDHSPEEMMRGLNAYLSLCEKMRMPITNQTMYTAMGLNKDAVYNISSGRYGTKEQQRIILYAKQIAAMNRELLGVTGTVDAILTIFWQKCYDGLNEMQEVNSGVQVDDEFTSDNAETIAARYEDLPD